ncbi:hypothetical protein CTI12_AA245590 [Artemisia annua]|uniref:Chromo domain-containing protein n=1 Tax=Artemisia annua TaxID=35608 RepID=A0A2U1NNS7_ARTAN|nr:hypothetical protein CTI12_AA245590 [Artemisia annua]
MKFAMDWKDNGVPDYLPQEVLQSRVNQSGKDEFLIKWESKPIEEATWESKEKMALDYPFFQLDIEDNVVSQWEGDDAGQDTPVVDHLANSRPKRVSTRPIRYED